MNVTPCKHGVGDSVRGVGDRVIVCEDGADGKTYRMATVVMVR